MEDIELTKKIAALEWDIDLQAGTCNSELVHYRIVEGNGYNDLKSKWISSEIPGILSIINKINLSAACAFNEALRKRQS
jgi:hypothetical protein